MIIINNWHWVVRRMNVKILNIDSLIDLKANESIRKMVEDLKEYIELKFVSLALVNDNYSFL